MLNPNQFALPGMERISPNPMAPHLAEGVQVSWRNNRANRENEIFAHDPGDFNADEDFDRHYGKHIGVMQWGDSVTNMNYPGEIAWVENVGGYRPRNPFRGLATALYHTADKMAAEGQFDTRPVHSETLTHEGERFKFKVGGPGHEEVDNDLIPHGHHAFERTPDPWQAKITKAKEEEHFQRRMGQRTLPGMEHRL